MCAAYLLVADCRWADLYAGTGEWHVSTSGLGPRGVRGAPGTRPIRGKGPHSRGGRGRRRQGSVYPAAKPGVASRARCVRAESRDGTENSTRAACARERSSTARLNFQPVLFGRLKHLAVMTRGLLWALWMASRACSWAPAREFWTNLHGFVVMVCT